MPSPRRLNEADANFVVMGAATGAPFVPVSLTVYERPYADPATSEHLVEVMSRLLPAMHQRIARDRLSPALPRWEDVPGFDPADHTVVLPAPGDGTLRAVIDWAQEWGRLPLPLDRPPWRSVSFEDVTVDGVPGRLVIVSQFHHALIDGHGRDAPRRALLPVGPRRRAARRCRRRSSATRRARGSGGRAAGPPRAGRPRRWPATPAAGCAGPPPTRPPARARAKELGAAAAAHAGRAGQRAAQPAAAPHVRPQPLRPPPRRPRPAPRRRPRPRWQRQRRPHGRGQHRAPPLPPRARRAVARAAHGDGHQHAQGDRRPRRQRDDRRHHAPAPHSTMPRPR